MNSRLLSHEHLKSLKIGDQFMTPGVLNKISPKHPMIWRLIEVQNGIKYVFKLSYFGAFVGEVEAKIVNDKIEVTEIK